MVEKRTRQTDYQEDSSVLLTQCHILEFLRLNHHVTITQICKSFKVGQDKTYKTLEKLILKGYVGKVKLPVKKHMTYKYFLMPYALEYLDKYRLTSFLDKNFNPLYDSCYKVGRQLNEIKRVFKKEGGYIVPPKVFLDYVPNLVD